MNRYFVEQCEIGSLGGQRFAIRGTAHLNVAPEANPNLPFFLFRVDQRLACDQFRERAHFST